jgi:hypothetical protein
MERKKAIEILTEHQKWRKGEVPNAKGGYWLPSVEQVTQAIDTLIAPIPITDEMVERAAIGIFNRKLFTAQNTRNWNNCTDDAKDFYRDEAKAALTAALEIK